jgi:hypothetical protein
MTRLEAQLKDPSPSKSPAAHAIDLTNQYPVGFVRFLMYAPLRGFVW